MNKGDALRVLVVDDHELFRTGLRSLLQEEGYEVGDAPSGEAAVVALPSFQPDVIVMDFNMPGMSGAEATARALEAMPSVGVVMLTINQEDHRVVEAIRPGAAGYLVKDADLDDIAAGIRTAANSSWAPAATRSVMAELRRHASGAGALPGAAPHRTRARRTVPAGAAPRTPRSADVST